MEKIIFSNFDDLKNPYYGGGGAVAIHEVAKRLVASFDVIVITGKYPGSKNEIVDGVSYKRIGIAKLPPQLAQLFYQFLLPVYALKEKYDMWVESYTPPFSTAFLPLFAHKPVIGLTHMLAGEQMSKRYHLPFNTIENFGLSFYKSCIVMSDTLKQKVLKVNPKMTIEIIPNGINAELLEDQVEPKEEYILFLGRLDVHQKGIDTLLAAYAKVSKEITLPLVIAGAGIPQDEAWVRQKIRELNLEDRVSMLGRVAGEQKKNAFVGAALLVAPSREENFPLVILEAFAYSLPVIATYIDGFSWVPDGAVDKVHPGNIDELAELMLTLSKDTHKRKIMGVSGREFVKKYTWELVAEKYKDFLKKL